MRPAPKRRIAGFLATVCFTAACSTTGSGGNPTQPSPLPGPGSTLAYTAIGASDVLGIGSSKPCFLFEDCNGNGYVWVAARQLRATGYTVNVTSLGIPAAVISRSFQDLGTQNGRTIGGNLIDQEMPFVDKNATFVTVFTGANDVNTITAALGNGDGAADPTAYIDQKVAVFGADYATLVTGIRTRAPNARIIALNLPNMAAMPYLAVASLAQKQAAQRISVRMTTTVINALPGVTVIDLMCDPRLYQPSVISSDGFHPNDAGYAVIGGDVANALTNQPYPAPQSSCSQMVLY
jgi:lysophospholipase L1-like esterase